VVRQATWQALGDFQPISPTVAAVEYRVARLAGKGLMGYLAKQVHPASGSYTAQDIGGGRITARPESSDRGLRSLF
jgi:hypothetical protein